MRQFIKRLRQPVVILFLLAAGLPSARAQQPVITVPPQNQSVSTTSNAAFSVTATGAALNYQWRFFGTNLPAATNGTLLLTNVSIGKAGPYTVVITNTSGAVTSSVAILLVDDDLTFRITGLQTGGAISLEHGTQSGDDRGGIAVSPTTVFVTGDSSTVSFSADDLSGVLALGFIREAFASNLRTEQVYSLGNGTNLASYGGGTVNSLIDLNGTTGLPTGTRINLSSSISMNSGGGIFSGYDRIVLWNGTRVYNISLPSGVVTDLGALSSFTHTSTESWAFWGLAEYFGGSVYLVYVQNSTTISRIRVGGNGVAATVASFSNLADMASISFSTSRSRWFFHHESTSQFRSGDETTGSAKATFSTDTGYPAIYGTPPGQTNQPDTSTTFQISASGQAPLSYQWLFNGAPIAGGTNSTLVLTNLQPSASGNYSVVVNNDVGSVTSGNATNFVPGIPNILTNPTPRSVVAGTNTTFTVGVQGALPLSYQWRLEGTNLPGATNASLVLTNIASENAGSYSVVVSNRFGTNTSASAALAIIVDTGFSFKILSLQNDATLVEHGDITGSDRGGLAVSSNLVVHSGNTASGRFAASDLSGGVALNQIYDALTGDLRTGKIYSLGSGTNLIGYGGGTVTSLIEIDGSTGAVTTNRINLSSSIVIGSSGGLFAGYGQVVLHTGTRVYSITLPSGVVADLGAMGTPTHQFANSWAYWGIAENFGGSVHLVYAQSSTAIVRTRVPDAVTTTVANFVNLADMASISASVSRGRWYFHHEGASEFGGTNQVLGYATATFSIVANPVLDHFEFAPIAGQQIAGVPFNVTVAAKNPDNNTVTNYAGPLPVSGLTTVGGLPVSISTGTLSNFVNGVWNGQITVLQSNVTLYLRVQDGAAHSGVSGSFSVGTTNDLKVSLSATPSPATIFIPFTYTINVTNTGPESSTGVTLIDTLPAGVTFLLASASQGTATNSGGQVFGDLGSVAAGAVVTVTIQVLPGSAGVFSNFVQVARAEPEASTANNSAALLTTVNFPSVSVLNSGALEGHSGFAARPVTFRLSATNSQTVTVNYSTANGSANSLSDYGAKSGLVTFAPGVTNQTVNFTIVGDHQHETNEHFLINLSSPTNAILGQAQASFSITNDDTPPGLTIQDITGVEGASGSNVVFVPVRISPQAGVPVQVSYTTASGTAVAGNDFVATSGTLLFTNGNTNLFIAVTIRGDSVTESNEYFYVNLSSPQNVSLTDTQAVVSITADDGIGTVDHFAWDNFPTNQEINVPFPVTITAKDVLNNTVSNFNKPVSLIAINPATFVTISGTLLGDLVVENNSTGDYTLGYEFTPNTNLVVTHVRHYCGTKVSIWSATGTLITSQNVNSTPGTLVETALAAPIPLTAGTTYRVSYYTGSNSAPYYYNNTSPTTFTNGTIGGGYYNSGDAFPDFDTGSTLWDVDLRYTVNSTGSGAGTVSPTNAAPFVNGVWSGLVAVSTAGSDLTLKATDTNAHSGSSAPFNVSVPDDLSVLVTAAGTVAVGENLVLTTVIANTGPSESSGVFLTNRFSTSAVFVSAATTMGTLTTNAGLVVIDLGNLESGNPATYTLVLKLTNSVTITNTVRAVRNEAETYLANNTATNVITAVPLTVTIADATVTEGQSGFTNAVFQVQLSTASATNVSVAFATANSSATAGIDYLATNGVLVFPPGVTALPIHVRVLGDVLNEAVEYFSVTLSSPTNATISDNFGFGTILNDDPLPVIAINDLAFAEGASGTTLATFTLTLTPASGRSVTVNFSTASGTASAGPDFSSTNGTATFPAGVTNLALVVRVNGDTVNEPDEKFYVNLSNPNGATLADVQGEAVLLNDDGVPGELDHFEWSPIATPQVIDKPFSVTLTARDAFNSVVTNFNGVLALTAINPATVISVTNTLLGDLTGLNSFTGDYSIGYEFTPNTNIVVTHVRHYCGTKVSIWTDAGSLISSQDVISTPGTLVETALATPVTLTAGEAYRVCFYTGVNGPTYYISSSTTTFTNGTLGSSYYNSGDVFPSIDLGTGTRYVVDLRYTVGALVAAPGVSISPSNTTPFVNGIWNGSLTIPELATNIHLLAADAGNVTGESNPFDVIPASTADLAVTIVPSASPVPVQTDLTITITISNGGPNTASGVFLTNVLPLTNVAFVSATASQGSFTNVNGVILCSIGSLAGGSTATLTLLLVPERGGSLTNTVTVAAIEDDPVSTNNTATLALIVSNDNDQDSLPDDWELANDLSSFDPNDAGEDPDLDGMTNLQEFLAGTHPHDIDSVLRLDMQMVGEEVHLTFASVNGKKYRIERSTEPAPVTWTIIADNILGSGAVIEIIDATPGPIHFYRIKVIH